MQRGESPSLRGQKWSRELQETADKANLDQGYDAQPTVLPWTVDIRTSDLMAVEIRQQLRHLIQPQDPRRHILVPWPPQHSSSKIFPLTYNVLDTHCTDTTENNKIKITMCNLWEIKEVFSRRALDHWAVKGV